MILFQYERAIFGNHWHKVLAIGDARLDSVLIPSPPLSSLCPRRPSQLCHNLLSLIIRRYIVTESGFKLIHMLQDGCGIYWRCCSRFVSAGDPLLFSGYEYSCSYRLWAGRNNIWLVCSAADVVDSVSCVQVWYYTNMYPKDPLYLKLLVSTLSFGASLDTKASPQVAAVLTFDTTHQILITHMSASTKSYTDTLHG